jgi:hypothetical protein
MALNWIGPVLTAAALLASAAPATAETPPLITAGTDEGIVVSGRRDPPPTTGKVHEQARTITRADSFFEEPLARFNKPVCPGVMGLPVELATVLADRIRYNVERVGGRLAEAGNCTPNLVVAFTGDGKADLQRMVAERGSFLADIPWSERQALLREPGPVYAWNITSSRTRDGVLVKGDKTFGTTPTMNLQSANSLLLLPNRVDIELSIVLIDVLATDGLPVPWIADYATMRGLVRTRPVAGDTSFSTILGLFHTEGPHPGGLTTFDLAYLKSIYGSLPNLTAGAVLGDLPGEMRKQASLTDAPGD